MRRFAFLLTTFAAGLLSAATVPNFSEHVYPIVRAKCQGCHQPGEIAPMTFTSYRDTRPWAAAIRTAVSRGTMPPWHADAQASRAFHNDRSLTAAERETLTSWVAAGAPEGPARDDPAPVSTDAPDKAWRLGKPDLVLKVPSFQVPAKGDVPYTFFIFPTKLEKDTWIHAAEWRIDKRRVVHHMNAFVRPPGSSYVEGYPAGVAFVPTIAQRRNGRQGEGAFARRELLLGYEPGYRPIPWGPRQGKLIPAGSDVVFECHFDTNGEETVDASELAIYFAKEPPVERVVTLSVQNMIFTIPPGDPAYRSDATVTFAEPVRVVSVQPHMHLRGKAMKIEAVDPAGRKAGVIDVPRYDFNWQTTYFLRDPLPLAPGARLDCAAWFDNSPNNKHNPDPRTAVKWGDQSRDEMHIGFVEIAFDARVDADRLLR
ncbi:MAG: thiol-disulfide isomerase [Acidobacteria bacterium]|nr:thiol-disulfide isomerase [Acidobacteriota bacterium]